MALHWSPDFAIGVENVSEVDDQHKRLFLEVNKVVEAVHTRDFAQVAKTLDYLAGYVEEHFAAEEKLMRETSYPEMQKHVGQHQAFVKRLLEVNASFTRYGATVPVVLKLDIWLLGWLWKHVRGPDAEMAEYLQRNTPTPDATVAH